MAEPTASRWPTVTALWSGGATWLFAALASLELASVDHDPTAPADAGYTAVAGWVPTLTHTTTAVLGAGLTLGLFSVASGRARRLADLLLSVGLGLGAWLLWAAEEPRPVAPAVVGAAAVVLAVSALLPERPAEGRVAGLLARLLLATVALLGGWVCAHELADGYWQLRTSSILSWAGLGAAALMLLAAALGPVLARPVWRRLLGLPTLLVGLAATAGAVVGLREGYLLTGYEEVEPGWWLGGPVGFFGTGVTTASLALLTGRWTLAVGTMGAAVLVTLGLVFGIPEMRSGF